MTRSPSAWSIFSSIKPRCVCKLSSQYLLTPAQNRLHSIALHLSIFSFHLTVALVYPLGLCSLSHERVLFLMNFFPHERNTHAVSVTGEQCESFSALPAPIFGTSHTSLYLCLDTRRRPWFISMLLAGSWIIHLTCLFTFSLLFSAGEEMILCHVKKTEMYFCCVILVILVVMQGKSLRN